MCPNINNKEVRNEFNRIIQAFGGEPMSIEEFKNKDLRNQRSGTDNLAMQIAYKVWDITNGEPNIPEVSVVSYCRNIIKERSSEPEKMLPNVNGTNGALPVAPNIKLYKDLKLLNKDNLLKSVKYSEAVNWTQKLNMKKGYEDYRFEYRLDSRKNGYYHIVAIYNPRPSSMQQELDFTEASLSHATYSQSAMESQLYFNAKKISKRLSDREIMAIASIASDIEKRFGIKFNISDKTVEAIAGNKSAAISNAYYSNGNGVFFYHSITPDLVIHEMFGHPLLNALKYTNNQLYDELYEIASKDLDLVSEVENLGYTGQHRSDEIIIRAIQKEYIRRKNNKFLHAIERMYSILCDSIRLVFGKNSIPSTIGFNSRIKDVLDYLLYGRGSFNLFDIESKEKLSMNIDSMIAELDRARSVGFISKKIYDIFKNDTNKQRLLDSLLSSVSSSYMSNDNAIYHGSMRETTISADQKSISIYNPKTEKRVLFESIDGVFSSKDSLTEGDLMAFIMSLKNINSDIIKFSLSSEKKNNFILNSLPKMVYSFDGNIFSYNNIIHNSAMPGAELDVAFALLPVDRIHVGSIISSNMSSSIQKISDGLKSQLHSAERSKNRSQVYIDSMRALIKDIEKYDDIVAMMKFVDFANIESEDVLRSVYKMAEQANSGDHIDRELLLDVNRNFISLYDTTISTIESLTTKAFGISDDFPKMDFKKFMVKLRNVRRNIDNIKSAVDIINKYEYINTIKEEGMSRGSTTVSSLTSLNQQDENNLFVECEDSSILSMLLGTMIMSKKEQHRILFSIVNDVKHRVNKRMETDGVLANLHSKWASVRKSRPLANFNSYHELDENGRSTGYLISNVKYGKFQKNYTEFIEKLNAKYNVSGFGSLPVDDAMASEYIKEKNKWMASNVERMFTNEYYKLREEISPSTQEMLDEIEYNIRGFYAKFKDENGVIRTERMSANDKDDLFNMKKAKEALGMLTFSDGTPKEVGSYEYNMAIEIQNFNKKLRGKLKYKPDYASFEAARNHAEKTLSTEEYKVWLNENSYTRFKDEFYEKLDKLNKADQSENWNRLYQIRKDLLRYNRDINSFEVSGSRIESKKDIAESIKKIDVYLSANRKKALKSSVSFKDIAEMVPTKEYLETIDRLSEDKSPEGVSKLNSFKKNSGYYNEYGTFILYSYWTKLEPKDKSMIETVPNFIWQEIDEDSEFYNKNYDKSLEKYGMQPNKTLYDNSSEYNKVVSTEADREFLDAFVEAMKMANENYYYMMRSNPYRLPQISGGFLHKIRMGDNFLSGLSKAIKDELQYTPEDLFVGDSESSGRFYADGTPVKHVPTRYRSMLEDTNMISRDLLGTFAAYYKASINFIEMNKEVPKIEVILNGLKNTEIRPKRGSDEELKNNKGVVKGGRSYQKAAEFVNEEVYGSSVINNYEFTLSRSSLTTSIENFIRKLFGKDRVASGKIGKVSMSKLVLNRLVPYTRLVNLFMNPQAIFSNLGGASVQQKIEASLGSFFTSEGLFKAKKEILLNMPSIMASSTNRNSDLITSIMRYYGVSRSNESDMKNLHGWKLGRFIKNNIWYGPYSAGDFAVKSPMVLAVLMNYKLYRPNENSEYRFYNREQFLSQFFPGEKRSDGVTVFDSIPDTLFSAYKMDGDLLTIKPEYSDFVDDKLEGSVSMLMQSMSRKLDGSLTGTERTQMHKDMIGAMLLLHKNYLLWAIQDRFHPKMFRYDLGIETSGIYKWNNVRKIPQVWLNMIIGKYGKANLDSKFEYSQVYAGRKLAKEMSWFVAITIAISLYGRLFIGDDDDKIKVSPEMFFNLLFTRTALEIASLWSPMEVYNLQKEPFGAIGTINELKDIFNMISSGTYNDVVRGGYYDGKTKLERSIYKSIPGVKQYYPYIGNPNYKRQDAFINSNLPSTYGLIRDAVWPDNWNKKAREKSEELYNRRIERENRLKSMGVDIEMLNKRKSDMEQKRDSLKELYGY